MSCFILSNKNFEYLKEKITYYLLEKRCCNGLDKIAEDVRIGNFDKIKAYVCSEVNKLHSLNYKAYNKRYGTKEKLKVYSCDRIDKPLFNNISLTDREKMQTFFLLACAEYQIMELDKWDKRFLRAIKEMLANDLAYMSIDNYNDNFKRDDPNRIVWGL